MLLWPTRQWIFRAVKTSNLRDAVDFPRRHISEHGPLHLVQFPSSPNPGAAEVCFALLCFALLCFALHQQLCHHNEDHYFTYTYSCLLELQPNMGLSLSHCFVTVDFLGVGSLAPRPNPNLEDKGLHSVWPLPFDLSVKDGPARNFRSRQHSSPCYGMRKPPLHDKAVVLVEALATSEVNV
jgi:hypothetical protein